MNTKKTAEEAKAALASLIKSAPKEQPRHKWQDLADAIWDCGGIMNASAGGFTVPLGDGRRTVEIEGGWTSEHYDFLKPYLSDLSEPELNLAMAAKAVLENCLRREGCQEPDTAFWLLCKSHGNNEETWLPQLVTVEGFAAIVNEMQDTLMAYRKGNPRRPLKIALMDHPHFDGRILSFGNKRWSIRKQNGPLQTLLTALENSGWGSIMVATPGQTSLAPNQVRLDPDDVRDAAKYMRNKTMPDLNWHASSDGMFSWSVP